MHSLDNTTYQGKKKPHGQKLSEFRDLLSQEIGKLIESGVREDTICFVRERGFSRFAAETQTIFRMVGVTDLVIWDMTKRSFEQIPPKEVKRLVAGNGTARKEEVAAALADYVGNRVYKTDDESDAVAVGIAWLIKNNYPVVTATEKETT